MEHGFLRIGEFRMPADHNEQGAQVFRVGGLQDIQPSHARQTHIHKRQTGLMGTDVLQPGKAVVKFSRDFKVFLIPYGCYQAFYHPFFVINHNCLVHGFLLCC